MEEGDEGAAAALGFDPQLLVNTVLKIVDDVRGGAFEYCHQEAAPKAIGAARAAEKAAELERGINVINNLVKGVLDRRMTSWEKYCLQQCFTVPEGFMLNEANSCAEESHNDGTSGSDLDTELDSLRRKIESANKESENLQIEMSSLEYKTKLYSAVAEIWKPPEDQCMVKFEDILKAIPKLQQKIMGMNKRTAEARSWNNNGMSDNKRVAFDKGFTASTEDILQVVNHLQKVPKE